MSKLVDERVVEMSFDNSKFEKNVRKSMDSIGELKASLDFSAVEVAAITAISNITNKITDMGLSLSKSLSVDNITAGWSKYESKSKSIGTLLSQGLDESSINEAVDYLSWFTDETSYSFDQMFNNITKFTAAGISLNDSVDAMMGIAEWAAAAGQNSTTASAAMYQLSQAMSNGVVRYEDWRQAITNKNMATTEIQGILANAGVQLGQLTKIINDAGEELYATVDGTQFSLEQLFSSTALTDKLWFTKDVFLEAMNDITGSTKDVYKTWATTGEKTNKIIQEQIDAGNYLGVKYLMAAQEARTLSDAINAVKEASQSAWSAIFENIFGAYKDSVKLWSELANRLLDTFVSPFWKIQELTEAWAEAGGMDALLGIKDEDAGVAAGALWNIYDALEKLVGLIKTPFADAFGTTSEKMFELTKRFQEFTSYLIISDETVTKISVVFKKIFDIFKQLWDIAVKVKDALVPLFETIATTAKDMFWNFGKLLAQVDGTVGDINLIAEAGEILSKALSAVVTVINNIANNKFIKSGLEKVKNLISDVINLIKGLASTLNTLFSNDFNQNGSNVTAGLTEGVTTGATKVKDVVIGLGDSVMKWFNKVLGIHSPSKKMEESGENIVEGLINGIKSKTKNLYTKIKDFATNTKDVFVGVFKDVKEYITTTYSQTIDTIKNNWFAGPIVEMFEKIVNAGRNCIDVLKEVGEKIKTTATNLKTTIDPLGSIKSAFEKTKETISKSKDETLNFIKSSSKLVDNFKNFNNVNDSLDSYGKILKDVDKTQKNITSKISEYKKNLIDNNEETTGSIGETVQKAYSEALGNVSKFLTNLSTTLKSEEDTIKGNFLNLLSTLTTKLSGWVDWLNGDIYGGFKDFYTTMMQFINNYLKGVKDLVQAGEGFISATLSAIPTTLDGLVKKMQTVKDTEEETTKAAEETVTASSDAIATTQDVATTQTETIEKEETLFEKISSIFKSIISGIKTFANTIVNGVKTVVDTIEPVIKDLGGAFINIFTQLIHFIVDVIKLIKDAFVTIASEGETNPLKTFVDNMLGLISSILGVFKNFLPMISEFVKTLTTIVTDVGVGENAPLVIFIKSLFKMFASLAKVVSQILPIIAKILDIISGSFDKFSENPEESPIYQTLFLFIDNLKLIITAICNSLKNVLQTIKDSLKDLVGEGEKDSGEIQKNISTLLKVVGIIVGVILAIKFLEWISPLRMVTDAVRTFSYALYDFGGALKSMSVSGLLSSIALLVNACVKITLTVGVLAAIDPKIFKTGMLRLSLIIGIISTYLTIIMGQLLALIAVSKTVDTAGKAVAPSLTSLTSTFAAISGLMLALAGTVFILVSALTKLMFALQAYGEQSKKALTIFTVIASIMAIFSAGLVTLALIMYKLQLTGKVTGFTIWNSVQDISKMYISVAGAMVLLSASVAILMGSITILIKSIGKDDKVGVACAIVGTTLLIISGLIAGVMVAATISAKNNVNAGLMNNYAKTVSEFGYAMMLMSAAVVILVGSIAIISKVIGASGAGNTWQAFGMVIATLVIVGALMATILVICKSDYFSRQILDQKVLENANKQITNLAQSMVMLSASILILVASVAVFALLANYLQGWKKIWAGLGLIVLLISAISAMIIGLSYATKKVYVSDLTKVSSMILAISVSVAILVAAVAGLAFVISKGGLNAGQLIGAIAIIAVLMALVSGMVLGLTQATQNLKDAKNINGMIKPLVAITLCITLLAGVVTGLAILMKNVDGNYAGATAIIAIVASTLSLVLMSLIKMASKIDGKNIGKVITLIIITTSMITVLAGCIAGLMYMATISSQDALNNASFIIFLLGAMLLGLVYIAERLNKMELNAGIIKKLAVLGTLIVALAVLAGGVALLAMSNTTNLAAATGVMLALGAMVLGLVGILILLNSVSIDAGAIKALLSLSLITGVLGLIIVGMAAMIGQINSIGVTPVQFLAYMATMVGAMLLLTGGIIGLAAVVGKSAAVQKGLTSLATSLWGVLLPITLITVAIAGLIAAIAYMKQVFSQNNMDTSSMTEEDAEETKKTVSKRMKARVSGAVNGTAEAIAEPETQSGVRKALNILIDIMFGVIKDFFAALEEFLLGPTIPHLVSAAIQNFINSMEAINEKIPDVLRVIKEFVGNIFAFLLADSGNGDSNVKSFAKKFVQIIVDFVLGLIEGLTSRLDVICNSIFTFIITLLDSIGTAFLSNSGALGVAMGKFVVRMVAGLMAAIWAAKGTVLGVVLNLFGKILASLGKEGSLINKAGKLLQEQGVELANTAATAAGEITRQVEDTLSLVGFDSGTNLAKGMADGINESAGLVNSATSGLATSANDTLENTEDMHSPSKVWEQYGKYMAEGLANGLDDPKTINDAINNVANSLNNSLEDDGVVIKPVLDLSDIQSGTVDMQNMLNGVNGSIAATTNKANVTSSEIAASKKAQARAINPDDLTELGNSLAQNQNGEVMNNTFNITGSNAKEIANEVNAILQKQLTKGKAAYGN